jgi:hypothetical protein
MTEPRESYEQLKRLLALQGGMLSNAYLTADLLRWKMLDAGLTIDRPPEIAHPVTGAIPPGAELVIRDREQEERDMEDEEIIKVPAFSEMDADTQRQHCELRHHVAMNEARHTVQHDAGLCPEHEHKPTKAQARMALAADIRFKRPVFGETAYTLEDES